MEEGYEIYLLYFLLMKTIHLINSFKLVFLITIKREETIRSLLLISHKNFYLLTVLHKITTNTNIKAPIINKSQKRKDIKRKQDKDNKIYMERDVKFRVRKTKRKIF